MILVDTSVIIDLLQNTDNEPTKLFRAILTNGASYGISILTYQEVLQGARSSNEEQHLQEYLKTLKIYTLPSELEFYNQSARFRRELRRKGITIRNTVDLLIASTAIHYELKLLHNDRDFDLFAEGVKDLQIYS